MTTQCSEVLMQVHYFLAREVMIDEHLYKACNKDAIKVCNGAAGWHKTEEDPRNQLVFPCLVRNLYSDDDDEDDEDDDNSYIDSSAKLSDECTHEVERTLRQRAMSVQPMSSLEKSYNACKKISIIWMESVLKLFQNIQRLKQETPTFTQSSPKPALI